MKNIFRLTAVALLAASLFSACTGAFEDMNTNPKGVSDEELKQDNNYIGMHFIPMMQSIYYNKNAGVNVWEYQLIQNLNADLWSGYISTATAFAGNVSNVTYAMNAGWNDNCWDYAYNSVMVESLKITKKCKDDMETYAHFEAINTICRVIAMSRLVDQYGCIIYSHYGESTTGGIYDSGQDAYRKFFEELKAAADQLRVDKEREVASFAAFDYAYGGDLNKWAKLCNTIRLRLAMRIAKYDAAWAKSEAEAAMNDSNGPISALPETAMSIRSMVLRSTIKMVFWEPIFLPSCLVWAMHVLTSMPQRIIRGNISASVWVLRDWKETTSQIPIRRLCVLPI